MTDRAARSPAGAAVTGAARPWIFWILGPLAVLGRARHGARAQRRALGPVPGCWSMLCLGVFYVVQAGPFIGLVQIIVYTGAIMMLFLFVLMLVGRDASDSLIEVLRGQRVAAVAAGTRLRRAGRHRRSTVRSSGRCRGRPGPGQRQRQRAGHRARRCSPSTCSPSRSPRRCSSPRRSGRWCWRTSSGARIRRSASRTGCGPGSLPGNYPGPKAGPGVYATADVGRHARPRCRTGGSSDASRLADPARARAHRGRDRAQEHRGKVVTAPCNLATTWCCPRCCSPSARSACWSGATRSCCSCASS